MFPVGLVLSSQCRWKVISLTDWSSSDLFYFLLQKATLTNDTKDKEYTPHDLPQRQSVQPQETCSIARRAKRMRSEVSPVWWLHQSRVVVHMLALRQLSHKAVFTFCVQEQTAPVAYFFLKKDQDACWTLVSWFKRAHTQCPVFLSHCDAPTERWC